MHAKEFLLQECKNVNALLNQTLRLDYGIDGSAQFFEECSSRLEFLRDLLEKTDQADLPRISSISAHLNELSRLICRIERSSISEYSWPFVEELKRISSAMCTESTLKRLDAPLPVFVLADGGLHAYRIYTEPKRPGFIGTRLLNIVFPKTLKHFVLLHSILGHEIGHAIFHCSKHEHFIRQNVIPHICHQGGQFESQDATADYLCSSGVPAEVVAALNVRHLSRSNLHMYWDWEAWVEELLCDLIGLTTFGPAFVAAEASLLYSLDLTGCGVGKQHPLVAWRVNILRRGCKLLGFDKPPKGDKELTEASKDFWDFIDSCVNPNPWFNILDDAALLKALENLQSLFNANTPAAYTKPDDDSLGLLFKKLCNLVPPVGFEIDKSGTPSCRDVDFRHILLAGWLAAKSKRLNGYEFSQINRLCEHGIMQQRAITVMAGP